MPPPKGGRYASFTSSLMQVWLQAQEQDALRKQDENGVVVVLTLGDEAAALGAKNELYHLRTKMRNQSRRNLEPTDPNYNTSPFDLFKIIQEDNVLKIVKEEHSRYQFEISLPEGLVEQVPRKYTHRKKEPDDE